SMSRFEIALAVAWVVVWIPGLLQLAEVWREVEYASHGFLVPFVSLWAATAHRETLARLPSRPVRGGAVLLVFVAFLYLVALALRNPTLLGLVAVATVTTLVLSLRGVAWLRTLAFPLGYLLFMVPLPAAWVTPLIVRLQLLVSSAAVEILQWSGVAIYREGNILTLPGDQSLFVAEACSGITSLITLLPIGVFIAYFTEHRLWRRLVLVFAVIPIALLANLSRVILTVLASVQVGVGFATAGPLHEWAGVVTYVIGCLCLLGVGALMRRFVPEEDGVLAGR
ncbi:MAG TPA: exosortase/archaeosortase family protein, partial [Deltaproteobacteria bacterium]|nr:exosortase/archaeosortase family protein [Deltaproteobacteria bacterium]